MDTAHDVFWLARYAHNQLAPLASELQAIEPSAELGVEMVFGHPEAVYHKKLHVRAHCHWGRDGMFFQSSWLLSSADVDLCADKVRDDIAKLRQEPLAA